MFFTSEDFNMLIDEANEIFNNLPFESRFSCKWLKANIKPLAASFVEAYDNVPCIIIPVAEQIVNPSELGKYVTEGVVPFIIPKMFGEDVVLNGTQYLGGIQVNDVLQLQTGEKYQIRKKERRGYGAYWYLETINFTGKDDAWLKGQYHRIP